MKADYIIAADINDSPCVTYKKEAIKTRRIKNITNENIVVVIKEIESWYIAGLDESGMSKLGLFYDQKTDDLNKEQFNRLIPNKFISKIEFMQEILKYFKIKTAAMNNKSFNYFLWKFHI